MVNCAKCGKKLGLFEKRFDNEDENGNRIKYCLKCNDEFKKENSVNMTNDKAIESTPEMPPSFDTEDKRIEQTSIRKLHLNEYNKNNEEILDKLKIKSEPIPNKEFLREVSSFCFICLKRLNINSYIVESRYWFTYYLIFK